MEWVINIQIPMLVCIDTRSPKSTENHCRPNCCNDTDIIQCNLAVNSLQSTFPRSSVYPHRTLTTPHLPTQGWLSSGLPLSYVTLLHALVATMSLERVNNCNQSRNLQPCNLDEEKPDRIFSLLSATRCECITAKVIVHFKVTQNFVKINSPS